MHDRTTHWIARGLSISLALFGTSLDARETDPVLDDIVVTATGKPEPRSAIAGTVQIIDR